MNTESKIHNTNETKHDFYIFKLFRGDIPLVITYWVFGVLVGGVGLRFAASVYEKNYFELVTKNGNTSIALLFFFATVIYSAFILTAIWRSAGKYEGNHIWRILARIVVVGNGIFIVYSLILAFDFDHRLEQEIRLINNSLPTMVDTDTRLDYVSSDKSYVYYEYTLPNKSIDELDAVFFNIQMGLQVIHISCTTEETRNLLERGLAAKHTYRDKSHTTIGSFIVSIKDC